MADLITTTELIVKLNLPDATEPTDRATQAVAGASAAVRDECGWDIYPVATGQVFTVDSGWLERLVVLPALHVTVTSVVVDGAAWATGTYRVDSVGGTVVLNGSGRVITVTYDAGYATVPEAVRDVCLDEAVARYQNPEKTQRLTEAIDDYSRSVTYFPSPELKTDPRLRAYRLGPAF